MAQTRALMVGDLLDAGDVPALVDTGHARTVLAAAADLSGPEGQIALAYARMVTGDWRGALDGFARIAAPVGPLAPGLAWRMGLTRYLRGEIELAEEIFTRGVITSGDTPDEALLLAWTATARWLRGAYDEARALAERADDAAGRCGDPRAVAGSQTVLTMIAVAAGDRCKADWHHLAATEAAERSGDVLARLRLLVNRADHLIEQGNAREALAELEAASALADRTGYVVQRAMALSNEGDAYASLGEYDAAVDSYLAARDAFQAAGSRMVACPLAGLGLIYRLRGEAARARSAYEESVQQAERVGNRDAMVAALAGLARVRAAGEPAKAAALADRALGLGAGAKHVDALLARGWISLLAGDRADATERARAAAKAARGRRDEAGLAEALELSACCVTPPTAGELADALELWSGLGNAIGVARCKLLATRPAAPVPAAATRQLRELGVRLPWSGIADGLALLPVSCGVRIQALGLFRVLRRDEVVTVSEWQSKKARDLLKILIARRGRPVTRDELIELLWPDDPSGKTSNRLSALLSTLRGILDQPDSASTLVTDRNTVRLDLTAVDVDVEHFTGLAAAALESWQRCPAGQPADAATATMLTEAEAAYGGDFCAEDLFESWTEPLREELRALHLAVVRALATTAERLGDVDSAVRWLLVLLRHDPYDESAHLALVRTSARAGRHGDARRHYQTYTGRMADLAIRPAPFPVEPVVRTRR